ncbi:MAG TPA: Nramp family divalent metal transporter [Verrucomicrobiae bacterium]|nr:Nramp family divalent metal transporter [Verrucomicrobiae bacterium]
MVETRPKRRSPMRTLLLVAAVLGPGFVTASAGNDVGGIAVYSSAGAQFGYSILWILVPLTVALIVVQEMATRMGCVTGKGLAALFRENFGVRISFFAMVMLFLINTLITATEFAGIIGAADIFHLSRWLVVPGALLAVFLFVLRFDNKIVERVFVVFSLIYVSYIFSAILAKPDWHAVVRGALVPTFEWKTAGWVTMIVGLIGTTISPYMQFFLQSAVVDKGSRTEDLPLARADVINGSFLAIALAGFMIIANAATIYLANQHGGHINPQAAVDFAVALRPLAGQMAATIFALGILNAGLFTATVLPLSTAYVICEAFGFEASIDHKFKEAPVFFTLFGTGLVLGAAIVLIPGIPLFAFIFYAQVVQGLLLPAELVLMLIIVNRSHIMGKHTNSIAANVVGWATVVTISLLSILYVLAQFIPQILGGGS